jgi:hypothetical protein
MHLTSHVGAGAFLATSQNEFPRHNHLKWLFLKLCEISGHAQEKGMLHTDLNGWRPASFFHQRYEISPTTWWRISKSEKFPAPIRIGRRVRWSIAECDEFLTSRK